MPTISLRAEELFHVAGMPLTNALALSLVVVIVLVVGAFILRRQLAIIPGIFQNIIESVIEGALELMDSVLGSREKSEKYLPLVATIFIFVIISNWFGILPGVGSVGIREEHGFVPFFRSPASDLNFTLAIALATVVLVNIIGMKTLGFFGHWKKFFNFQGPIQFFVGLLELISECAKIVSFSFRLFGNIFAGEVLLVTVSFLVPYFIPVPFLFVEIFVGFIQAFVFAMLALVFVAIATTGHESEVKHSGVPVPARRQAGGEAAQIPKVA